MKSFTEYLTEKKDSAYELFFQKALGKFGVDSPEDLDDEEKKKFFDYVDSTWDAKKE